MSEEAIPLYAFVPKEQAYKPVAYACPKCKTVAASPLQYPGWNAPEAADQYARERAAKHCGPWLCKCGAERNQYTDDCHECREVAFAKREADREAAALAKARRVNLAEYEGEMLYIEGRDKYVTLDEIEGMRADGDLPAYAWACTELTLKLDAYVVIENALAADEHHEDSFLQLNDGAQKALQKALDSWVAKYAKGVRSFFPDYSMVVDLGTEEME